MKPLFDCAGRIDQYLDDLTRAVDLPEGLRTAVRYALLGGGKRLRPVLAWRCCEAADGEGERALPACAAVELIHAFSLVHDDLPAIDNDDLRRGRPALHIRAGEAGAILAGDAMMALAFETLACRVDDAALGAALLRELSSATVAMIGGQWHDTLGGGGEEEGEDAAARLARIHQSKTGALIRASCRMGALCGGAGGAVLGGITEYAQRLGLMFQIVDDLLDVRGTSEQTGKRTGKDAPAGKLTYPGVYGEERSAERVEMLLAEALAALAPLGQKGAALRELAEMAARRRT